MGRHYRVASWSLALASMLVFMVGASAEQIAGAVSQAVVTPSDPIWAQDPAPTPRP